MSILKHVRDKVGDFQVRALLHMPIGFIIGFLCAIPFNIAGYVLAWLFIRYETNEDRHTQDEAWKDYYGAMLGFVPGFLAGLAALIISIKAVFHVF